MVFGAKKNNLILNFQYEHVQGNYLLLVSHFFLLVKIFCLILALSLQTVPHSAFLCRYMKVFFPKAVWFLGFSNNKHWYLIPTVVAAVMPVMRTVLNYQPEQLSWHVLFVIHL